MYGNISSVVSQALYLKKVNYFAFILETPVFFALGMKPRR
jgi:hypothetical protein